MAREGLRSSIWRTTDRAAIPRLKPDALPITASEAKTAHGRCPRTTAPEWRVGKQGAAPRSVLGSGPKVGTPTDSASLLEAGRSEATAGVRERVGREEGRSPAGRGDLPAAIAAPARFDPGLSVAPPAETAPKGAI